MKQKSYGGALGRYQKRNELMKKLACFGLFFIGFLIIGALTNDALTGLAYAALPFGLVIPSDVTDPVKIKELTDDYLAKNGGEAGVAIKEMLHKFNEKQLELTKLINDKADETKIKALQDSLASIKDELNLKVASYNDVVVKQGLAIKELQDQQKKGIKIKSSSFYDTLLEAFSEKSVVDQLNQIKSTGTQTEAIKVKVAIVMGEGNTIGSGSTQYVLTENSGIISVIRKRELTYRQAVSVGSISKSIAVWIEETDEQGTPIFIAEAASKTQLSVKYVEKTESVKKIAVYGKVTTELLSDLPQLVSYIQNNIMRRLDITTEDKLFNALGVGDDPKGMYNYATTFTGGSLGATVAGANELDVIEAVALQVKEAYGNPDTLFIHPSTMSKIKLIKDDANRPIWKDYITTNGVMNVSGLNIVETTAITAGNFIGGDTKVVQLLFREELGIQIGLDGNDFTQNKKTLLAEKRLVQFVSANDTAVLVKGDFTSAIALITLV